MRIYANIHRELFEDGSKETKKRHNSCVPNVVVRWLAFRMTWVWGLYEVTVNNHFIINVKQCFYASLPNE